MKRTVLMVGVGLAAALLVVPGAQAQRRGDDWYRDVRPYLGGSGAEAARRVRLWEEFVRLRGEVKRVDRRGDISLKDADHLYNRLDHVADFLRNDKHLTEKEYNRRRGDLDGVARDLERAGRNHTPPRDTRR
jgi:hypothetical protein